MSVAKQLQEVQPFFIQDCPLCERPNRIIVSGVYRDENGMQKYPDIGFSFCNCKNVFYTRFENLTSGVPMELADPIRRMKNKFDLMRSGEKARIVLPDPFFCEWGNDPYTTFFHWDPRTHWIIWDKDQFEDEMRAIGFEIFSSRREFDVQNVEHQQTFEVVVRKP